MCDYHRQHGDCCAGFRDGDSPVREDEEAVVAWRGVVTFYSSKWMEGRIMTYSRGLGTTMQETYMLMRSNHEE